MLQWLAAAGLAVAWLRVAPQDAPRPPAAASRLIDASLDAARRIDVNRADAVALEQLPGIGPVTAERIIVDRRARGPFAVVEELRRVSGVTPSLLERVRPFVWVNEAR